MIWSSSVISNFPIVGSVYGLVTLMTYHVNFAYRGGREGLSECSLTHPGNKIPNTMWVSVRIGYSYGVDSGNPVAISSTINALRLIERLININKPFIYKGFF